jgi:hypothetical protein
MRKEPAGKVWGDMIKIPIFGNQKNNDKALGEVSGLYV